MCCKYFISSDPEIRQYVDAAKHNPLTSKMIDVLGKPLVTRGGVVPSSIAPVIALTKARRSDVFPMVWGFDIKGIDHPIINARTETASEKKSFQQSWKNCRCVIPASYYYEWGQAQPQDNRKIRYVIQPKGVTITFLAALYRFQKYGDLKYPVFTILTKEPSDSLRQIHDRMPVVLPESVVSSWINPDRSPEEIVEYALTEFVAERETARV